MSKDITCIPTNLSAINFGTDRLEANQVGGTVQAFTAGATLLIGDAVYMGSGGKLLKSTTATLYTAFVGFVVGGWTFNKEGQCATPGDVNTRGATAAVDTEPVFVQIDGIANAIVAGALTIGAQVVPSGVTAGRVVAAGATAGAVLGVVVTAGSATVASKILINAASAIVAVGAGAVAITDATDSTSTATGSIQTAGGLGVVKALWVGGLANIAGVVTLANTTDSSSSTTGGTIISGGLGVAKKLYVGTTLNVGGVVTLADTTESSSSATGSLIVAGGVGIAKKLFVAGESNFTLVTDSSSTITGAVIISGGVGIAKKLYVGTALDVGTTLAVAGVATLANATDSSSSVTGGTIISGGVGIAKKLYVGTTLNVAGIATLADATDASNSTTGGTVVTGGIAVAKKAYIGTSLYVGSTTEFSGKFGYGAVGGIVTQGAGTGKATAFTLSKLSGQITTDNAVLNAATIVSAVWTNTTIGDTDVVVINHVSGGTIGAYTFEVVCGAGTATLYIRNATAGNLTEALVLRYVVVKGAIA